MSGIYIPGISMPRKGEYQVAIFITEDGAVDVWRGTKRDATPRKAISVPDHGDLIDKDETMNAILEERGEDYAPWFAGIVNEMPAIIPADTAEEGE